MSRPARFVGKYSLYAFAAALLVPRISLAADDVQVSGIECTPAACEAARSATTGTAAVRVVGQAPKQANSSLGTIILDENEKLVHKGRFNVKADGSFRVLVPVANLAPGKYKFGIITLAPPSSAIVTGSFSVAAALASAGGEPKKGIAGFLDRLNAGPQTQNASSQGKAPSSASQPAPQAASSPAAPPAPASGLGFYSRTFGLAIPGVAYTTDNYATNTRTVTVASGYVTKSSIRVNPDGTYVWNSTWDGKIIQGRWRAEGGGIIVLGGESGLNWKMDKMSKPQGKAEITLWDQKSIWYNGTPLNAN